MKLFLKKEDNEFDVDETIEAEVKPFSKSSAHIILPKKFIGRKVIIGVLSLAKRLGRAFSGMGKKYKEKQGKTK